MQMELRKAIRVFERIFEELPTGNSWALRANFEKDVSKMNLLEIDYTPTVFEYSDSLSTKVNTSISINSLYYKIRPMNCGEAFHQTLEMCVQNNGPPDIEVLEIFELERHSENTQYSHFVDFQNKMLLWHGCPLGKLCKILSQGSFINGAVRRGEFGTGIYFSDIVEKALNRCWMSSEIGWLILCEVALGRKEMIERSGTSRHRSMKTANEGYDSVLGCGELIPDPKEVHVEFASGALLPLGKPVRSSPTPRSRRYNEYAVYNEGQVKLRYLVKVRTWMYVGTPL